MDPCCHAEMSAIIVGILGKPEGGNSVLSDGKGILKISTFLTADALFAAVLLVGAQF